MEAVMKSSLVARGRFVAAVAAAALVALGAGIAAAAPAQARVAPHTWYVLSGTQSPDRAIQGMVFLPGTITIDVGDTIVWVANSAEPHTVTFNAPAGAQFNPGASAVGNGSRFDGSEYVSSGALANVSAATAGFPTEQRFSLTFTKAGTFTYICLVHPGMGGTVVVRPAGTPYPESQRQYDTQGQIQRARIIASGYQLMARDEAAANDHFVIAGDMDMQTSAGVMRYMRSVVVIRAGQSVRFANQSMMPHTVTFGSEQGAPCSPDIPTCTYGDPTHYQGGRLNSGWFFGGQ